MKKWIILIIVASYSLTGCYKENNPNDEHFTIIGDIAQVSSLTAPSNTAQANGEIELTVKLSVRNTTITFLQFYQRLGTSGDYIASLLVPFVEDFSEEERVFIMKVPYPIPDAVGATISIQVEAITANELVSNRVTVSPNNIKIN